MVDGFFVANYVSETALGAVNISLPFISLLFGISVVFAIGTQTMCGVLLGRGNKEEASRVFTQSVLSLTIFSLILGITSFLNMEKIAILLGAKEDLIGLVENYLGIIMIFSPFFIISYNLEVLVKIDGYPYLSIIVVAISALTNIFLDYLFVAVYNYGIKGAAIATGISQLLATLIFLVHFLGKKSNLKFRAFKFHGNILKKIIHLGIGSCIAEIGGGAIIFLYNHFIINYLGERALSTYTVISYVTQMVAVFYAGISQGMSPLVSYYYGKNKLKEARIIFKYALISTISVSLISFGLINCFSQNIFSVFLKGDLEQIIYSKGAMAKYSFSYLLIGYNIIISGFSASMLKPNNSIIINILRSFVMIGLALFLLSKINPQYIWFSSILSEGLTLIFSLIVIKALLEN